jgi:hypothetical protein
MPLSRLRRLLFHIRGLSIHRDICKLIGSLVALSWYVYAPYRYTTCLYYCSNSAMNRAKIWIFDLINTIELLYQKL